MEASDADVAGARQLRGISTSLTGAFYIKAATAVYIGLFAYFCLQTRVLSPYSDLLDLIDFYFRNGQGGNFLSYLLEPHGHYHRIPWLRLQVAADMSLLGGNGLAFVLPAALGLAGVAWMLARRVADSAGGALKLPAATLTLMLVLTSANAADVSTPASSSYVQTFVFSVLAILFATARPEQSRRATTLRRAVALACACGAGFGNAVGLVIWPALAFSSWRAGRAERTWLITLVLVGTAFVVAYVAGLPAGDNAVGQTLGLTSKSADYFIAYLGLPWVRASGALGRTIGALLFTASIFAVLRTGGPDAPTGERVGLSLVLFSLGTAAMAAVGRGGETGPIDVPVRYAMLLVPLHVGLLLLALPRLRGFWETRPRMAQVAILAALVALLAQQLLIGTVAARAGARSRDAIVRFERGERTPDMTALIHPDIARASAIDAEIRRRRDALNAVP